MMTPRIANDPTWPHAARRWGRATAATALIPILGALAGCQPTAPGHSLPPPPEVDVAKPVVRESVEWDEYTGRLAAVETVDVRTRVTGYLEQIHFKAGQIVHKGDPLFTIDQRPFVAEVDRGKARIKQAEAELEHAKFELRRVEGLREVESAQEKEYRDVLFAEHRASAQLDQALAAQRIAELNLEWSSVVAPISGRISRELVTVGNLVHDGSANATLLTTIVSLDPIHCNFDADEQSYLKYARMSRSGERASSREYATPVKVALFDETDFRHEGWMDFVDNTMDQWTGTMRGRAVLPNPDGLLIPGLFVRVRLIGSGVRPMIFVPDAAISTDQTSRLVFMVDDKNVVHPRTVKIGRLLNGLRRVTEGLDGSETLVINGIQRVRPETMIKPNPVEVCAFAWSPDAECPMKPASQPASGPATGGTP